MYLIKVIYKAGNDEYRLEVEDWDSVLEEFRDYADVIGGKTLEELQEIEETYGSEFEIVYHDPLAPLGKLTLND